MSRLRVPIVALLSVAVGLALIVASGALQPQTVGQEAKKGSQPATGSSEEQAVRKAQADHIAAMNRGDLDAIMAHWAADADYIDESGKVTKGRAGISALFKKALPGLKGTKITGKVNSLKFLRPDVAMEDGTVEFTAPDGTKESNRYAVVRVKTGGQWLISSARDLPAEVDDLPSLAYAQLKPLEWLVGDWRFSGEKTDVTMSCRWGKNKAFLVMDYELKREGADAMLVQIRIGWDGANNRVRSWIFDDQGGFGEGFWEHDGKKWQVGVSGVLPDGGSGGATQVWEFVDHNTFIWRATERDIDGQPLPDVEVKFTRQASAKQ